MSADPAGADVTLDALYAAFHRARAAGDQATEEHIAHRIRAQVEGRSVDELAADCPACRKQRRR